MVDICVLITQRGQIKVGRLFFFSFYRGPGANRVSITSPPAPIVYCTKMIKNTIQLGQQRWANPSLAGCHKQQIQQYVQGERPYSPRFAIGYNK